MSRGGSFGLIVGVLGGLVGVGAGIWTLLWNNPSTQARAQSPLTARLDTAGPYLILATETAAKNYAEAIGEAKALHAGAATATFSTADLSAIEKLLAEHKPRYVLVFIAPEELDVNFAWQWLRRTTAIDDDPFVDARSGFITGESPQAVLAFVRRIRAVAEGRVSLPGAMVDDLGPNTTIAETAFQKMPGSFMIPVYGRRFGVSTISHGPRGFGKDRLDSMAGAGILHFGGHGYPDRIVDALNGPYVRRLKMAPCVTFNGACYTGVTGRWYDMSGRKVAAKRVDADKCFCLGVLANQAVAYLAALHPDHGIPVYQEMEYMAVTGAPLGDVLKHTHDGVILASGAKLPDFETFSDGMARPRWSPSDTMLKGTAARVLFGDPALIVTDAFAAPPFEIAVTPKDQTTLQVQAVLKNADLKSTFTDTYYADLAKDKQQFNDCARFVFDLPEGWDAVKTVKVTGVSAGGATLEHRLVGFGVEKEGTTRRLHVQVDVPSTGYMQSPLRRVGAKVELEVSK